MHDGNHASLVPEVRNSNNTCQPKLIIETNNWLVQAVHARLCQLIICAKNLCMKNLYVKIVLASWFH